MPRFTHDCDKCAYLGEYRDDDLYFCPQGRHPTVSSRFGNAGPDYISGLVFVGQIDRLTEAARRAVHDGLLKPEQPTGANDGGGWIGTVGEELAAYAEVRQRVVIADAYGVRTWDSLPEYVTRTVRQDARRKRDGKVSHLGDVYLWYLPKKEPSEPSPPIPRPGTYFIRVPYKNPQGETIFEPWWVGQVLYKTYRSRKGWYVQAGQQTTERLEKLVAVGAEFKQVLMGEAVIPSLEPPTDGNAAR